MRRFLINSKTVRDRKRKRRFYPGGTDTVSTEGVPSSAPPQNNGQSAFSAIPIIGMADQVGGMVSNAFSGLNDPGPVDAYGVPINKDEWIKRQERIRYLRISLLQLKCLVG